MLLLFRDVIKHFSALVTLVEVTLKTSVASTRLGWIWWIVNPLIMMAIYYFFVSVVLQNKEENYHLFILVGIIVWQSFSTAVNQTTTAIQKNAQLIKQSPISIPIITLIPTLVQTVYCGIGILIVLLLTMKNISINTALLPLLFLAYILSCYGIGLVFAIINAFIKDTKQVVAYILRAGFFLTPILYSSDRILGNDSIPQIVKTLYQLNPMAWIIPAFRDVLLYAHGFDMREYLLVIALLIALVQVMLMVIRKNHNIIVKSV
jgi:lipopolysaccharide transport system permease protein